MKKLLVGLAAIGLWGFGYSSGHHAGYASEHTRRVSDEVATLVQANEEQRGTIVAMDARYTALSSEIDKLEAENTRLIRSAKAKREGVTHAIEKSATWSAGVVPVDVADSLRAYAASGDKAGAGKRP